MQQLQPEVFRWTLSQPPPRPLDTAVLEAVLSVYFPRLVRWMFAALPVFIILTTGLLVSVMVSRGRYGDELRLWRGPTAVARGEVMEVTPQHRSKGGILYIYKFRFEAPGPDNQLKTFRGVSFAETQVALTGQAADIEYLASDPQVAVLIGCRMNFFPPGRLAAVPLMGIVVGVLPTFIFRWQKNRLTRLLIIGTLGFVTVLKVHRPVKGSCRVEVNTPLRADGKPVKTTVPARDWILEWLRHHEATGDPVEALVDAERFKSVFFPDLLLKDPKRMKDNML